METLLWPFCTLKGAYQKEEDRLFRGTCVNRTRGDGFKLKRGQIQTTYEAEVFYSEVTENLEQIAQRIGKYPVSGNGQGQTGWCSEQPENEIVSAHCRGAGLDDL